MKKSTILIVALIYIVSFIVVGFFGVAIRGYDKVNYVDYIELKVPEQGVEYKDLTNYEVEPLHREYDYQMKFVNVEGDGMLFILQAQVYPTNSTYKKIDLNYEQKDSFFTLEIQNDYYIHVHIKKKANIKFKVQSTDGKKLEVPVDILAY